MRPYDAVTLKKIRMFKGKNFPPAPFVPYMVYHWMGMHTYMDWHTLNVLFTCNVYKNVTQLDETCLHT
jgi:hypothetical protein